MQMLGSMLKEKSMNRIFLILLIVLIISCNKKPEEKHCSGEDCIGKQYIQLSNSDKTNIPSKDTVYKFVNINKDTMVFRYRTTNLEPFVVKSNCECIEKSTEIHGNFIYSIYSIDNIDLALGYFTYSVFPSHTRLSVNFSDTNTVIHKISKETNPCSIFTVTNYTAKQNDFDSLNINGKYYYNIINTFDYVGICKTSILNEVYFSKNFGLVRFKYNNFDYYIIH